MTFSDWISEKFVCILSVFLMICDTLVTFLPYFTCAVLHGTNPKSEVCVGMTGNKIMKSPERNLLTLAISEPQDDGKGLSNLDQRATNHNFALEIISAVAILLHLTLICINYTKKSITNSKKKFALLIARVVFSFVILAVILTRFLVAMKNREMLFASNDAVEFHATYFLSFPLLAFSLGYSFLQICSLIVDLRLCEKTTKTIPS